MGRIATFTGRQTGNVDLDLVQDELRRVVNPALANPLFAAGDFQWVEVAGANPSIAPTFVLQYRTPGTQTWKTVATFGATPADTAWLPVTFQNSWANFGAPEATVAYRRDADGRVWGKGYAKSGTIGLVPVYTLPAGYRPSENRYFACRSTTGAAIVNGAFSVRANGEVWATDGNNAQFGLEFSFYP
jgi:hypothetical protein